MYNLVHEAAQEMIIDQFGEDIWNKICVKGNIRNAINLSENYSDVDTHVLFTAAGEVIGTSIDRFLKILGEYLVGFVGNANQELFTNAGNSFIEFVGNLNRVFEQLEKKIPYLTPPKFLISDLTDDTLILKYISQRNGLNPLIEGMLIGLGFRFNIDVSVEQLDKLVISQNKAIFKVSYSTPNYCQTYI